MNSYVRLLVKLTLMVFAAVAQAQIHSYDAGGRLTRTTYPDGRFVAYRYDAAGNLTNVTTSDSPGITTQPTPTVVPLGSPFTLQVTATGPATTYAWYRNGQPVAGANSASFSVAALQPSDAGLYTVVVTNASGSIESRPVLVAPTSTQKLTGSADSLPEWQNIRHPNGNIYDQVLLTGPAATLRADPGQVTRVSFIDTNNDIVQVEFSGAGCATVVLESPSGPLPPSLYNQAVNYMKGRATVTIAGADENTYVSVFSVGRSTAFIPYARLIELGYTAAQLAAAGITLGASPTDKVPTAMGGDGIATFLSRGQASALFKTDAIYDGISDLRALAIQSPNGKFGGIFGGNLRCGASQGPTGIHAPAVTIGLRAVLNEIRAEASAQPMLQFGACPATLIAGGSLKQTNAVPVLFDGMLALQMVAGSSSHGVITPAQPCRARFERNGTDVTLNVSIQGP